MILLSHRTNPKSPTKRQRILAASHRDRDMVKDTEKPKHLKLVTPAADRLTSKQEHFCQMVAKGETLTEAYRKAYDVSPKTKPSTVWSNASKLATENTKVAHRIKSITEEISARKRTDEERLKIWVIDRLKTEAMQAESDSARVASLTQLGRSIGMFSDRVETENVVERSAGEIEADIQRRLAAILGE